MNEFETPVIIIPLGNNKFKFFPVNMEAITAFLEQQKELEEKQNNCCGAI